MDNYTRDIFDINVGTLDVIVFMVLNTLGMHALRFGISTDPANGARATDNAQLLIHHFADQPIQAIKAIRETSGLDLKSSKDAWDQICETYDDGDRRYVVALKRAIKNRDLQAAEYYASKL